MSSLVKKRPINYEALFNSPLVERKKCTEDNTTDVMTIPGTSISMLKASFPSVEDQILERALTYCNMNVKSASILLQNQVLNSYSQQAEEKKLDVPTEKRKKRTSLIQLYIDSISKAQNYEEAAKITELLLKRYKEILKPEKMNTEDDCADQNRILKKGMRILIQRYESLCQTVQEEQKKTDEAEKRVRETVNEINYYKTVASSLMNKIRELNLQGQ